MDSLRFLPTSVHGALDYIVGVALIFAPKIFGFDDVGGAAETVPLVLGIVLIVYSLFTNYEWGVFKVVGMPYHLMIDFLASAFLVASPWIFGFADLDNSVWLPHVIVGAAVLLVVAVSQTQPGGMARTRRAAAPQP